MWGGWQWANMDTNVTQNAYACVHISPEKLYKLKSETWWNLIAYSTNKSKVAHGLFGLLSPAHHFQITHAPRAALLPHRVKGSRCKRDHTYEGSEIAIAGVTRKGKNPKCRWKDAVGKKKCDGKVVKDRNWGPMTKHQKQLKCSKVLTFRSWLNCASNP